VRHSEQAKEEWSKNGHENGEWRWRIGHVRAFGRWPLPCQRQAPLQDHGTTGPIKKTKEEEARAGFFCLFHSTRGGMGKKRAFFLRGRFNFARKRENVTGVFSVFFVFL
jgi:hypothetical protein